MNSWMPARAGSFAPAGPPRSRAVSRRAAAHRRQRPARLTGSEREHDRQSPTSLRRAKSRQARQRAGCPAMLTDQA
jgi:hypothetical protein